MEKLFFWAFPLRVGLYGANGASTSLRLPLQSLTRFALRTFVPISFLRRLTPSILFKRKSPQKQIFLQPQPFQRIAAQQTLFDFVAIRH